MRWSLLPLSLLAACTTYLEPSVADPAAARSIQPGSWSDEGIQGGSELHSGRHASALAVGSSGALDVLFVESYDRWNGPGSTLFSVDPRVHPQQRSIERTDSRSDELAEGLAATALPDGRLCFAASVPDPQVMIVDCGLGEEGDEVIYGADGSHSSPPAVAAGPDGEGHAIWASPDDVVRYRTPDGAIVDTYQAPGELMGLELAFDGAGDPWILALVRHDPTDLRYGLYLVHGLPDGTWEEQAIAGTDNVYGGPASITLAAHGDSLAYGWVADGQAHLQVDDGYYVVSYDSTAGIEVAYGPHGTPHAVWTDDVDIKLGALVDGAWVSETVESSLYRLPDPGFDSLHFDLDDAGIPYIVSHRKSDVRTYVRSSALLVAPAPPTLLTVDDLAHGDLVVTEVLANPSQVSDTYGEWIEVYNPTQADIALDGLVIEDAAGNVGLVQGDAILAAGAHAVLGRRDADSFQGTDVVPLAHYGYQPALNNGGDQVFLYGTLGLVDAAAAYDSGVSGVSWQLDAGLLDADANDDPSAWCLSSEAHASGELATPGAVNDGC